MTQYLTPHEIATMLKISYEKSLAFIKYSGVKYIKVGNQYRVSESALTTFLQKNTDISCI